MSEIQLRRAVIDACDGPFGSAIKSEHYAESGARVIRLGNIGTGFWKEADEAYLPITYWRELPNHHAAQGDVVVAGLGDENNRVGRACVVPDVGPAIVKADCYRFRVDPTRLEPRYLAAYLSSEAGLAQARILAEGSTRLRLTVGKALSIRIPNVCLDEQRRIADFLDAETSRIDKLAETYSRLSDLLGERFQAVIDRAVDPQAASIPFKYLVKFREGPGIMAEDFRDEGVPLIRIGSLQDGQVTLQGVNYLDPEKVGRKWSHFRLALDDRIISGSATMGAVSVVRDESVVGAIPYTGLVILRPNRPEVDMGYIDAYLQSSLFFRQIDVLKTGSTMQHFGPIHLAQIKIPNISSEGQKSVAREVNEATRWKRAMRDLLERQKKVLSERRQALITAAVTGQFDVSTASGRNTTQGV